MSFRLAATFVAFVCAVLFVILLLIPASYMATYGVNATGSAIFMGRRASPLMLGLAVLLFYARDLRMSPAREAIRTAVIVIFAGIALTGILEFMLGNANGTILIAAFAELLVAAVFLWGIRDP